MAVLISGERSDPAQEDPDPQQRFPAIIVTKPCACCSPCDCDLCAVVPNKWFVPNHNFTSSFCLFANENVFATCENGIGDCSWIGFYTAGGQVEVNVFFNGPTPWIQATYRNNIGNPVAFYENPLDNDDCMQPYVLISIGESCKAFQDTITITPSM